MARTKSSNSSYQTLYLWTSFLLGMISLGIIVWNRRSVIPVNPVIPNEMRGLPSSRAMEISRFTRDDSVYRNDNFVSTYQINLSRTASSIALGIAAYQLSGNPIVGLLSSWPLFLTALVAAKSSGLRIVVPEFRVNSNTMSSQDYSRVASLSAEEWVVVWQGRQTSNLNIYAQRYVLNGNVLGPEFRVNNNTARDKVNSAVASLNSGGWVVAWQSSQTNNYDIYAQRFVANGSAVGPEFRVNSNTVSDQGSPAVANLNSGEWVAVWIGFQAGVWNIYGQRYAQNGSAVGPEFQVNSNTTASRNYPFPTVASLSSGDWVVVWQSLSITGDADIYGQRYALNGSIIGTEFRVNSNAASDQGNAAVVSLSSGEWVVVWYGDQTGNRDIYGQRYAINGSVVGPEFRVNSNTASSQYSPAVISSSAGEWVVVWQGNQAGNYDIYGQRYALNGSVIGSEFQVNINNTGDQTYPSVASLSSEVWVVVWTGTQTGNSDVYGSIFSSTEPPLTTTLEMPSITNVATSTATTSLYLSITTNDVISASATQFPITTASSNNSLITQTNTSPLDTSVATSSSVANEAISTNSNTQINLSTQQRVPATNDKSDTSGTTIGIAAGLAGAIGLGVCAAAIGFYAYRKKSNATKQSSHAVANESDVALHDKKSTLSGEYGQINLKNNNQSNNILPVSHSNYGRIDEMKQPEKQYDNPTKLEI